MTKLTLDTSGEVGPLPSGPYNERFMRWSDLTPFQQGYVEAAFSQPIDLGHESRAHCNWLKIGFSDLAPETLAAMLADCETYRARVPCSDRIGAYGRQLWHARQAGFVEGLSPVVLFLGDDGKIYEKGTRP